MSESRTPVFLAVLGAVAAVHFFRDSASFVLPPLSYEDGRDFFAFYYNHRHPGAIFRFYAGYVSLLPNLVGYTAMALPTSWAPRALAWAPGGLTALACALPYLTLRRWMSSPMWRAGTCFTLALLPVANRLFLSSTAYSLWSALLILVWLSILPSPATVGRAVLRGSAMVLLICSHPLSVALVPLYAVQGWQGWTSWKREPEEPAEAPTEARWLPVLYPGALIAVVGLYGLLGIEPGGLDTPAMGSAVGLTIVFVLERVVFATVFGDAALLALRGAGGVVWVYLGALGILAALAWAVVSCRRRLADGRGQLVATLGWLVVAFTALYVLSRTPSMEILSSGAALRYFWAQRLLFAVVLAILAHEVWAEWGSGRRPSVPVALWVLFLTLAVLNLANGSSYRSPRRPGHQMAAFVQQVEERERAAGGRVTATLPRSGPWSIELQPGGETSSGTRPAAEPMP